MFYNILHDEHPEKNSWWINELDSLGVDTKSNSNELKDKQDNSDLVEAIKHSSSTSKVLLFNLIILLVCFSSP